MRRNSGSVIIGLVGCMFGVWVTILFKKYTSFTFNTQIGFEINPFEIVSLTVNIILAIYIAKTLSKQNDKDKTEKELLINELNTFKTLFSSKCYELLMNEDYNSLKANSDFKIIRKKLNSIVQLAIQFKFIEPLNSISSEIKEKVSDTWELFTDSPRESSDRSAESDIVNLKLNNAIEENVIEIERLLFLFSMQVLKK